MAEAESSEDARKRIMNEKRLLGESRLRDPDASISLATARLEKPAFLTTKTIGVG